MSVMRSAVDEYLALRRTLGFKLDGVGHDLQQFVRFAESEGVEWVMTDLALRWAIQPAQASPAHWARRLGIVRQFAQYYSALDPRTEIPPPDLLPYHYVRKPPYELFANLVYDLRGQSVLRRRPVAPVLHPVGRQVPECRLRNVPHRAARPLSRGRGCVARSWPPPRSS